MTPNVRALLEDLGRVGAPELLKRLGKEPGPDLLAERWAEVAAAARPAVAREISFDRRVWPKVQRLIGAAWLACLVLAIAAVPLTGSGVVAPRLAAALGLYVGYASGMVWLWTRRGFRNVGLAAFLRPLLVAAAPIIAVGLWPPAAPWTAPTALGIAVFLLAFVTVTALPRLALLRGRHTRPRPWAVWFLVQALVEAGGIESAASPQEREQRVRAAIRRLDRTADVLERSMHRGGGWWARPRARRLRASFGRIAASFRDYGDQLAWQWAPDAVDCLAAATAAMVTGEWDKLRRCDDKAPTGRRRRSRAIAKRVGLTAIPLGLIAALWVLPVGVEATVLTSLTLSACVWSIDYLVSAISPELGSELSSMGEILSAAFS